MLIAHLPSGYLLARAGRAKAAAFWAALLGSVAPDFDMIWFHLIDQGRVLHHEYWSHLPAFWGVLALIGLPLLRFAKRDWLRPVAFFFAGIFLHLILDTLVGGIIWGWPFDERQYQLAVVPARYGHWVINFMLHWSFLAEIAILLAAIWLGRRDLMRGRVATARGAR